MTYHPASVGMDPGLAMAPASHSPSANGSR
jgi:hypothetical protein